VLRSTVDSALTGEPMNLVHPVRPDGPARYELRRLPGDHEEVSLRIAGPLLDRRSAALLVADLVRGYAGEVAGQQVGEASPTTGMRDLVAAEWDALTAPTTAFWRRTLEEAPEALAWRTPGIETRPAAAAETPPIATEATKLPTELVRSLWQTAAELEVPPEAVFSAAYLRVLGLLTGRATVGTWMLDDTREALGISDEALGDFRSLLPLALRCDAPTWGAFVRRTAAAMEECRAHRPFPVAEYVGTGTAPETLFEYCEMPTSGSPVGEGQADAAGSTVIDPPVAALTLTVEAVVGTDDVILRLYRDGGDPLEVLEYLRRALAEIAGDLECDPRRSAPLLGFPAQPPAEPAPSTLAAEPATLHALIARQADRTPDAPAIIDGDSVVDYAELHRRAAALAERLHAAGAPPGGVVGVHVPRGADLLVALLAVLSAGCAFLPLDVRYPRRRCEFALGDAGADLLLTRSDVADRLAFPGPSLVIDLPDRDPDHDPTEAPDRESPEPLAYVLHTSGSTGRPKGVAVPHASVVSHMRWAVESLGLGPGDRVAQRTPVAFDAAVWELFAPLAGGAAVVIVSAEASRDMGSLETVLREHEVTVLQVVPSLLAVLAEGGALARCPKLRLLCSGGEALPQRLADEVIRQTDAALINLYGPTETCVQVASWRAELGAAGRTVPIGTPVTGVRLYLLGELGEPVPPGVPGEVHIGGVQVAWGYRGRAGETADRFVPDHLSGLPGARLYRTGDRARRLPGGELEFLNRTDDQVKVRGVRTEPGEVEAVLNDHPRVRQAAVVAHRDRLGATDSATLVAFVSWTDDAPPDGDFADADLAQELREYLRGRIPEAMVPTSFVSLAEPPLLPNGKLDRRRLRTEGVAGGGKGYRPPADAVEEQVAARFADALGVDAVGRFDDLVELGARPLHALRLATWATRELGRPVPADQVLNRPTVAQLMRSIQPG
jgi:amino acid adenylation domain-containing protein